MFGSIDLQVDQQLVGKAIDCLRILTTGNDGNKVALFTIPSSLSSIVRLLGGDQPMVSWSLASLSSSHAYI